MTAKSNPSPSPTPSPSRTRKSLGEETKGRRSKGKRKSRIGPGGNAKPLSTNEHLLRWVDKMEQLCRPADIHWVDGSQAEYESICELLVRRKTFIRLNPKVW